MQEIISLMKEKAAKLLAEGTVARVLGWKRGEFFYDAVAVSSQPWTDVAGIESFVYYIDDVKVIPIDYFKNPNNNQTVESSAEAGYYADTFDGEPTGGAISFDAYISNEANVLGRYDKIGMFVYKANETEIEANKQDVFIDKLEIIRLRGTDKDTEEGKAFAAANGFINVLVDEIGVENFDEKVLILPYVVMRGVTFYGEAFTYCVNDAGENLKWLGNNN